MTHVLVTRPAGQASGLCERLRAAGYRVSHRPGLRIQPLTPDARTRAMLMDLDQYHAVILVSANAARLGLEALADVWPQWPVGPHWIAVGDATAQVLEDAGLEPWLPETGFNSEAVLELPPLQNLAETRVLILRGEDGRGLLAERLVERGARVDPVILYRRSCDPAFEWPREKVDILLVTSVQSWQCLSDTVSDKRDVLVLAGSERIAEAVRATGHERLAVAASPRDEDMLAGLELAASHREIP